MKRIHQEDIELKSFYNGLPFEAEGTGLARLLFQLTLILLLPRVIHFLVIRHLSQPRAVSEMVSGLLLGPSFLGKIPGWMPMIFPDYSFPILKVLSMLGSTFFLFIIGLGIDLRILFVEWRLVFGSVILSACLALLFAAPVTFLFDSPTYTTGNFAELFLFLASLLGITATGLLARILSDRGILNQRLGAVTMATTAVNAIYHSLLFASALSMYGLSYTWIPPDPLPPGKTTPLDAASRFDPIFIVLLFIGLVLTLSFPVRWLFHRLATRAQAKKKLDMGIVWLVLFTLLAFSFITQSATLAARLGGFLFSLLSIPRIGTFCQDLRKFFEGPVVLIFIPLFYGWNGIRVDFFLLSPTDVGVVFLLVGLSFLVKFSAMYMLACAHGMHGFKGVYFGILNATKGFAGVILCNVAVEIGFISRRFFAMTVLFAVVSTIIVTPLIRVLQHAEVRWKTWLGIIDVTQLPAAQSVFNYRVVMIPSSPAFSGPLVQLVGHIAQLYPPQHSSLTALRTVHTDEMDDSFSAMYLEGACFEELCQDPILASSLAAWRAERCQLELHLKAMSIPHPVEDILGYIHGEGTTGQSLEDEDESGEKNDLEGAFTASRGPFQCVALDYEGSSQISLVEALLTAGSEDVVIAWNVIDLNVQSIYLLLGSTEIERKNESMAIFLACSLASRNPDATLFVGKHLISEENPLPSLNEDHLFNVRSPELIDLEDTLEMAILNLAQEISIPSIIIAPQFLVSPTSSLPLQGYIPGFENSHPFEAFAASPTPIVLVSQNYFPHEIEAPADIQVDIQSSQQIPQQVDG